MNIHNEQLLQDADLCIKENKIENAITILNSIILDDPLFGKAHNHLGFVYETKIKNLQKAEEHYKIALATAPNYCAIYYNYAILLSTLKKYDELKELLTKAESIEGINKSTIYNEWAILHESSGNLDLAIDIYKKTASTTFDNKTLDIAMTSVERCNKKKSFLNNNSGSPINNIQGPPGT
jgi:tetratricopeptide (TPR) repeat protein